MIVIQSGDSAMSTRQATWIGARAKSLAILPGFSGRILAILSDVAYLSGRGGEILWLFREGVPLHWRGIQTSFPLQCLHSGQGFLMEGCRLKIGKDLDIDLGRAVEWMPNTLGQCEIGPIVEVNDRVRRLLSTLAPTIGVQGPGQVVRGLSSVLNGRSEAAVSHESWQMPVLSPVFDLMTHCLEGGLSEIETRGRELIGLGPGLTPCGDDFLGGLFFAAHWLQEAYPGEVCSETQSIFNLIQWARNRTHPVSHAILGDLAIGQGPEPLHRLLGLLLKGGDLDGRTMDAVDCLLKVGHTTGWCILAGVLTRLLSVGERQHALMTRASTCVRGKRLWPHDAVIHGSLGGAIHSWTTSKQR